MRARASGSHRAARARDRLRWRAGGARFKTHPRTPGVNFASTVMARGTLGADMLFGAPAQSVVTRQISVKTGRRVVRKTVKFTVPSIRKAISCDAASPCVTARRAAPRRSPPSPVSSSCRRTCTRLGMRDRRRWWSTRFTSCRRAPRTPGSESISRNRRNARTSTDAKGKAMKKWFLTPEHTHVAALASRREDGPA